MAILDLAEEKASTYRAIGNAQTEYSLPWIEGLRANLNLGFDVTEAERENFTPSVLHRQVVRGRRSRRPATIRTQINTVLEAYLNYTAPRPVGPGTLDLTGGYSWTKTKFDSLYFEATGLSQRRAGERRYPPAAANVKNIMFVQQSKLISFFGRANYNIDDKYILAAFTIRHDGSSRFGDGNDYGTFPSVAVAWRLSEEPFLRGVKGLSDLKLRGSWALTGNQSFGNYLAIYILSDRQWADPVPIRRLPLHHQPAERRGPEHQVGGDARLQHRPRLRVRNQRLSGAIDWYGKLTDDLLFTVPVAALQQLVELRHHQRRQHAEHGVRVQPRCPDPRWRPERDSIGMPPSLPAATRTTSRSITPFGGSTLKVLAGELIGGFGTRSRSCRLAYR